MMFRAPRTKLPPSKSKKFSKVKVENVVNPPKIPAIKNERKCEFKVNGRVKIKPIKKPPKIFTQIVPKGKVCGKMRFIKPIINTRKTAPIKPPEPIAKIL